MDLECETKSTQRKSREPLLESVDFSNRVDSFSEIIERISQMYSNRLKFLSIKRRIPCLPIGMDASITTLEGIKELCEIDDAVDAFVLLRKVRDNLFLDLFLMSEAINKYPCGPEFNSSIFDLTEEQIVSELMKYISATIEIEEQSESLQTIYQWGDGNLAREENKKMRRKYFGFSQYLKHIINKCPELKECHDKHLGKMLDGLENQLNNYVHSNSPEFLFHPIGTHHKDHYVNVIKSLLDSMDDLKRIFIIVLYFIDSTLFATDDYIDAMDMGIKPLEGSQYYTIDPVVDEFKAIKKEDPGLYEFLKANNKYGMKCFEE